MKNKFSTGVIIAVIIVAVIIFGVTLKNAVIAAPQDQEIIIPNSALPSTASSSTSTIPVNAANEPDRLIIPSLSINAHVQHVGISIHGTMAVPTNYTDVGWYRYGPIPGNPGNAVMAGHLDNGLSLPGVFKHLGGIKAGDEIDVQSLSGTITKFVVTGTSTLDYNTQITGSVFENTGQAQLKLITCEGTWDEAHKTYSNRLIVTALEE